MPSPEMGQPHVFGAVEVLGGQRPGERGDHPGGRPPDEVFSIGHGNVMANLSTIGQRVPLMVCGIHQEGERNLKNFRDLVRVRLQIEWRCDQGHDGRYTITRNGAVFRQVADNFDMRR